MVASCPDIVFDAYDPADERRRESLLGLGNGMLFVRACATDAPVADPTHYPGTYRAGCYNRATSIIQGERVDDELLVNLPNWLPLTFRPVGETAWFCLDDVEILAYRHGLNLRCGIMYRTVRFRDVAGRETTLSEHRLVSMTRSGMAGLRLELTPENWDGPIELRSALNCDSQNTLVVRYAPFEHRHLDLVHRAAEPPDLLTVSVRTRQSRTEIALAVRTRLNAACEPRSVQCDDASVAERRVCRLRRGETVAVEKIVAIATSRDPATGDPGEAARTEAAEAPDFDSLQAEHVRVWAQLRQSGRIEAAQPELARAVALHRFHVLQTISPLSVGRDTGFPARGWQEAYRGQIFWDEIFVFPFLNLRFPELARSLLMYRYHRLDQARRAARRCGLSGAMFPWRSAGTGEEATPSYQLNLLTGTWSPDHTRLQRHIGAAIAYNAWQYYLATGDTAFLAAHGAEMILEVARFWASLARFDPATGRHVIVGVIGPDEYHNAYPGAAAPGLDNNAYTNVMAVWTLCRALEVLDHLPQASRAALRARLELSDEEFAAWDRISRTMRLEFHGDGIISQFAGFERLREIDVAGYVRDHPNQRVNWALEREGGNVDALQVTKQADVLMLFHLLLPEDLTDILSRLGYHPTRDDLRRTAAYYLQRVSHELSLSRVVCAGALAQLDPAASWRYFRKAMVLDLTPSPTAGSTEGLHLGAMAGTLDVLQRHYLGLRIRAHGLALHPSPPQELGPVRLAFGCRGDAFALEANDTEVRLRADAGNRTAMPVEQRGRRDLLAPGGEIRMKLTRDRS